MVFSCSYIDGAISFNRTNEDSLLSRITFCSIINVNNGIGRCALIENYDGTPIDWDELQKKRVQIKNDFAKGIFPEACIGCCNIKNTPPSPDNKINMLAIASWEICNSKCIYCEAEYLKKYNSDIENYDIFYRKYVEPYDMLQIVKDITKKEILDRNAIIDITGGEPTLYPKFNDILACLLEYECKNIRILTNTIIYSPVIEKGIRENAVTLIISIDAGSQKVHEKVKGVCSYNIIRENIKKYSAAFPKNHNHDLDLKYILIEGINDSKKEIDLWIKNSKKDGATRISMNITNQMASNVNLSRKSAEKMFVLSEYAVKKAKKNNLKIYFHPGLEDLYTKFRRNMPERN